MAKGMTFWSGTDEIPVVLTRWNGSSEVALDAYSWNGSTETPCFTTDETAFVNSAVVSHGAGASSTTINITVPSGVTSGHSCLILLSNANSAATITTITGCSSILNQDTGSMQAAIWTGTGHTAADTVTITGTNLNPSGVAAVWYNGTLGTLSTPATRGGSVTTIAAASAPSAVTGDKCLVLVAEKSSTNTDTIAPVVSGVTQRAWAPWSSTGTGFPSAYIAEYDAPASSKTATYLRASANALAVQVRVYV